MGSEPLAAMHLGLFNTDGGTKAIWITEVCMQLNQLDSLFKVYPVTIPLHVSVLLVQFHSNQARRQPTKTYNTQQLCVLHWNC